MIEKEGKTQDAMMHSINIDSIFLWLDRLVAQKNEHINSKNDQD